MANSSPRVAAVTASMAGSVMGDDSQKAITGASGTPAASSPAISGRTVTPQTGVTAPIAEANRMTFSMCPANMRAMPSPAPLAMIQAASRIPGITMGATETRLSATNANRPAVRSGTSRSPPAIRKTALPVKTTGVDRWNRDCLADPDIGVSCIVSLDFRGIQGISETGNTEISHEVFRLNI